MAKMLKSLTEEVKKQAEQRISSRYIMCVLGIHDLALKIPEGGRRYGKSGESQKTQKSKRLLRFRAHAQSRNDRGAPPQ